MALDVAALPLGQQVIFDDPDTLLRTFGTETVYPWGIAPVTGSGAVAPTFAAHPTTNRAALSCGSITGTEFSAVSIPFKRIDLNATTEASAGITSVGDIIFHARLRLSWTGITGSERFNFLEIFDTEDERRNAVGVMAGASSGHRIRVGGYSDGQKFSADGSIVSGNTYDLVIRRANASHPSNLIDVWLDGTRITSLSGTPNTAHTFATKFIRIGAVADTDIGSSTATVEVVGITAFNSVQWQDHIVENATWDAGNASYDTISSAQLNTSLTEQPMGPTIADRTQTAIGFRGRFHPGCLDYTKLDGETDLTAAVVFSQGSAIDTGSYTEVMGREVLDADNGYLAPFVLDRLLPDTTYTFRFGAVLADAYTPGAMASSLAGTHHQAFGYDITVKTEPVSSSTTRKTLQAGCIDQGISDGFGFLRHALDSGAGITEILAGDDWGYLDESADDGAGGGPLAIDFLTRLCMTWTQRWLARVGRSLPIRNNWGDHDGPMPTNNPWMAMWPPSMFNGHSHLHTTTVSPNPSGRSGAGWTYGPQGRDGDDDLNGSGITYQQLFDRVAPLHWRFFGGAMIHARDNAGATPWLTHKQDRYWVIGDTMFVITSRIIDYQGSETDPDSTAITHVNLDYSGQIDHGQEERIKTLVDQLKPRALVLVTNGPIDNNVSLTDNWGGEPGVGHPGKTAQRARLFDAMRDAGVEAVYVQFSDRHVGAIAWTEPESTDDPDYDHGLLAFHHGFAPSGKAGFHTVTTAEANASVFYEAPRIKAGKAVEGVFTVTTIDPDANTYTVAAHDAYDLSQLDSHAVPFPVGALSGEAQPSPPSVTRSVGDTRPITFTGLPAGVTVTGTVSIDGAASVAVTGAITAATDIGGQPRYELSHHADDRPSAAGSAVYTFSGGGASVAVVLSVEPAVQAKLTADGLDAISVVTPSGPASNFRHMVILLYRRFFGKSQHDRTAEQIKVFATDGTSVITTQSATDDGTTQSLGESS